MAEATPVLAYFLHDFSPLIVKFGNGIALRWYGLAYVLSFVLGYWLYRWLAARRYTDMRPADVADFITWAAIFGVMLGGRIGWILFYGLWERHDDDPLWPIEVWRGGMASHGGIIGLVLFTLWWARRHKLSWTSLGDSLCTVAAVGICIVRCANFVNGELWGKEATVPWAVQFPTELAENGRLASEFSEQYPLLLRHPDQVNELLAEEQHSLLTPFAHPDAGLAAALRQILPPRHPSQLYQAFLEGALLFVVLWLMRTRMRLPRGVITGAFFILYAVLRIIGELFRVPDSAWSVGPVSAGQFLSLFMFLIGGGFLWWGFKTRDYEAAFDGSEIASGS